MNRRKLLKSLVSVPAALATVGISGVLAGVKCETLTFDLGKDAHTGYVEIIRKMVLRMAQDAVGKAEKGKEMTLLKHYIAVLKANNRADNIQFGYGTFTGPRSEYVSIVDALHWNIYGKWGDVHDPHYWAQHSDGEWYII